MTSSIDALQRREKAAWDAFYDAHVNEVYGFVFRLVRGDRLAADDLFQEIWLAAINQIQQFDPQRGELRGWLFGIARRKVALYWRQRTARDAPAMVELGDVADSADNDMLPEEVLEQVERGAVVQAMLLMLPPDRREVLTEKYLHGLSVEQIAVKSDKTAKAVESLLSRARTQLRRLCGRYFDKHGVVD